MPPNSETFAPLQQAQALAAPTAVAPIALGGQVEKVAQGDFSSDPTSEVFRQRLKVAQEQNALTKQALQNQFAQTLQGAQEQATNLIGQQKSRLAKLGGVGTSISSIGQETDFTRKINEGLANLQTEQATQTAQVSIDAQTKELDIIEAQYGLEAKRQAEAQVQQLEVAKQNAQIQMMNQETQLAVAKFNADMQQKGREEAQRNAMAAGYVVGQDGQLVPTIEKEKQVQAVVEQDRRYTFDVKKFEAEERARQAELALQTANLTGDLGGVKTLGAKSLDLQALKLQEDINQFNQQIKLKEQGQTFDQGITTETLSMEKRAQQFNEALQDAEQIIKEKLANNTIKKTDADIAMDKITEARQGKMTNQQIRASDLDMALKLQDDLRKEKMMPLEMDKTKAQTAALNASAAADIARAKNTVASALQGGVVIPDEATGQMLNKVIDREDNDDPSSEIIGFNMEELNKLSQKDRDKVLNAYNYAYRESTKASDAAAKKELENKLAQSIARSKLAKEKGLTDTASLAPLPRPSRSSSFGNPS